MYKTNQDEKRGFYSDYDEYISQSTAFCNLNPEYREVGLWGYPANNNFKAGVGMVNEYATIDPDHINPITHEKGSPHAFIFKGLEDWWWEQGDYTWLDKTGVDIVAGNIVHPEIEDPNKPNHLMDCTRYFFISRPKILELRAKKAKDSVRDAWLEEWKPEKKPMGWKTA